VLPPGFPPLNFVVFFRQLSVFFFWSLHPTSPVLDEVFFFKAIVPLSFLNGAVAPLSPANILLLSFPVFFDLSGRPLATPASLFLPKILFRPLYHHVLSVFFEVETLSILPKFSNLVVEYVFLGGAAGDCDLPPKDLRQVFRPFSGRFFFFPTLFFLLDSRLSFFPFGLG